MKVNDRITRLRRELVPARQLQKAGDQPGYEREASRIYDNLRKTWERAVEEVLLNGTILRFGDAVQTQRLRAVADDLLLKDIEATFDDLPRRHRRSIRERLSRTCRQLGYDHYHRGQYARALWFFAESFWNRPDPRGFCHVFQAGIRVLVPRFTSSTTRAPTHVI
ncbi:MAG: hypothetical protein IH987_06285 [Planctomycetes bacterium]|nr:hypothetical protein [Planctomycetota bacterium]